MRMGRGGGGDEGNGGNGGKHDFWGYYDCVRSGLGGGRGGVVGGGVRWNGDWWCEEITSRGLMEETMFDGSIGSSSIEVIKMVGN